MMQKAIRLATPYSAAGTKKRALISGGLSQRFIPSTARRANQWLLRLPVFAATYFSKIGIPGLGSLALTFAIPSIYLAIFFGLLSGRFIVDRVRFQLFVMMAVVLGMFQIFFVNNFSVPSILYLYVIHLPYIFSMRTGGGQVFLSREIIRKTATVIAICGLIQYGAQYVIGPIWAYPIESFSPESMKVAGFNTNGWIEYGSETLRANGIFMLEPSFFSQLLAVGIIAEFSYGTASLKRVILYVAGIMASYSGTGILMLCACFPVWIIQKKQWKVALYIFLLAGVVFAVLSSGLFSDNKFVKVFLDRSTEFSSPKSSGFARFVGGFYMFDQYLWIDPIRSFFGTGAGTFLGYSATADYAAHGMAVFKMFFEFGIIGGSVYFFFLGYCFFSSKAPAALRVAIFVAVLIQNYVPFGHGLALALLIWSPPVHLKKRGLAS
jgi:hypothetical protein